MSPRLGLVEMLILPLICIFSMGIPVATLVLVFLLYEKVKRIEARLNLGGEVRQE